ncbi:hypothetical protein GCM10018954_087240 [Kutzneria kofuensis]
MLLVPYFLPAMHERYFFLADALTVVAAFYLPRKLWALPVSGAVRVVLRLPAVLMGTGGGFGGGRGRRPGGGFRGGTGGSGSGGFPALGRPWLWRLWRLWRSPTGWRCPGFRRVRGRRLRRRRVNPSLVDMRILATAMLGALALALWVTVREFRCQPTRPDETA